MESKPARSQPRDDGQPSGNSSPPAEKPAYVVPPTIHEVDDESSAEATQRRVEGGEEGLPGVEVNPGMGSSVGLGLRARTLHKVRTHFLRLKGRIRGAHVTVLITHKRRMTSLHRPQVCWEGDGDEVPHSA